MLFKCHRWVSALETVIKQMSSSAHKIRTDTIQSLRIFKTHSKAKKLSFESKTFRITRSFGLGPSSEILKKYKGTQDLEYRQVDKVQNPVILSVIHNHQTHLKSTNKNVQVRPCQSFCNVMQYSFFLPCRLLQNINTYLPDCTVSYSGRCDLKIHWCQSLLNTSVIHVKEY
jgi:hypothetical protein